MTEKDLWAYRDAKRAYRIADERLREYEASIYSPSISNYTGMPAERGCGNVDKLSAIAERHGLLTGIRDNAAIRLTEAGARLDAIAERLPDDEALLLHYRYRLGLSWRELETVLHYGNRQVYRLRRSLLARINS